MKDNKLINSNKDSYYIGSTNMSKMYHHIMFTDAEYEIFVEFDKN